MKITNDIDGMRAHAEVLRQARQSGKGDKANELRMLELLGLLACEEGDGKTGCGDDKSAYFPATFLIAHDPGPNPLGGRLPVPPTVSPLPKAVYTTGPAMQRINPAGSMTGLARPG